MFSPVSIELKSNFDLQQDGECAITAVHFYWSGLRGLEWEAGFCPHVPPMSTPNGRTRWGRERVRSTVSWAPSHTATLLPMWHHLSFSVSVSFSLSLCEFIYRKFWWIAYVWCEGVRKDRGPKGKGGEEEEESSVGEEERKRWFRGTQRNHRATLCSLPPTRSSRRTKRREGKRFSLVWFCAPLFSSIPLSLFLSLYLASSATVCLDCRLPLFSSRGSKSHQVVEFGGFCLGSVLLVCRSTLAY